MRWTAIAPPHFPARTRTGIDPSSKEAPMARFGLFLRGFLPLLPLLTTPLARAGDDRDNAVAAALAVQTAMQQGREFLLRNDARSAVQVLESQLARINGNAAYLALLRDAYRAYIQELRLANQAPAAQVYVQRLQILDPGAALELAGPVTPPAAGPAPNPPAAPRPPTPATSRPAAPVVRATMEDEPPEPAAAEKVKPTMQLLARAEAEFANRRFQEAGTLYAEAYQKDPAALGPGRERWAYCKLHRAVELINQPPAAGTPWAELEAEVRHALELAPRLEYGKYLLEEIQKRRRPPEPDTAAPAVPVRHTERGADGWARAETANFRIFHNQSRELAEQVGQIAERTRQRVHEKWFGGPPEAWTPVCEVYLHATTQEYVKVTGAPGHSPGHSTIRTETGRITGRRIDLRCDEPDLVAAILPHETAHVVLASQFPGQSVPRWADEGVAVLTESRERVERYLRNLPALRQQGQLLQVSQLLQLQDYPEPRRITAFYAQSVSLVEYLADLRGPQVFSQFLRDALRGGYEPALQKHYQLRDFDELQLAWAQKVFAQPVTAPGLAKTTP
jgi:hypothetical protein